MSRSLALSWRMLLRDRRAGELRLLELALVLAVASISAVGFFGDRVRQALNGQTAQLLGADLAVSSDHPLAPEFAAEARRRGLASTASIKFPSMVVNGGNNLLAEIKAVDAGYPLRGALRISSDPFRGDRAAQGIPQRGSVWVDGKLFSRLGLRVGDALTVGQARFTVAALIAREPDSAASFLSLGPRLLLNREDLAATALIQPGSRIAYRLLLAGEEKQVAAYRAWAAARLLPGEKLEGVRDARPEIRGALERAEKFLRLAALTAVMLAAVALLLGVRRYLQRHLDGCAVMRCVGASRGQIVRLHVQQFLLLGVYAGIIGCVAGWVAQQVPAYWLEGLAAAGLPQPGLLPALAGMACGMLLLLGFALPALFHLGRVPALRVLRRELGIGMQGAGSYALAVAALLALLLWQAGGDDLAWVAVGAFFVMVVLAAALVWVLLHGLALLRHRAGGSWRYGIANLRRRALGSITQTVALSLGVMALLTLTLVRADLLRAWKSGIPQDAPNQFLVNIQQDQLAPLRDFFAAQHLPPPVLYPMVRARLVALNGRKVSAADYRDEHAQHLIDREFNLSSLARLPDDNRLVAGEWWGESDAGRALFSVEEGIAQTLGIRLGDMLTYDAAGSVFSARVASLRKVDWNSFHVNFFVIAAPGLLDAYPASYITSFHLAPGNAAWLNKLIKAFPNFVVIDVAGVLAQVQQVMDHAAYAVEFVFLFTLAAGVAVLFAAFAATHDERVAEAALMRVLGASRRQIVRIHLAEFLAMGVVAGLLAAGGASVLGHLLASEVLHVPYAANPLMWLAGCLGGGALAALSGMAATRGVLRAPPLQTLRG